VCGHFERKEGLDRRDSRIVNPDLLVGGAGCSVPCGLLWSDGESSDLCRELPVGISARITMASVLFARGFNQRVDQKA
jgi:hypothetical protein